MQTPRNPYLTVDVIIELESETDEQGIVMIERKNPPHGWALPGGFVDYGETLERAVIRETKEETSLDVKLIRQFHAYSDPKRDERQHNVTVVYHRKAPWRYAPSARRCEARRCFQQIFTTFLDCI